MAAATTTNTPRKGSTRNVLAAITALEFDVDLSLSYAKRAAQVLDQAAAKYAYQTIPWRYLFKMITQQRNLLPDASPNVLDLKKRSQAIRSELEKKFSRGFVVDPTTGVRATVDDEDFANHVLKPGAKRMLTAQTRLQQRAALVNVNNIKDVETKNWVNRLNRGLRELTGLNLAHRFRLLPRATEGDAENSEN